MKSKATRKNIPQYCNIVVEIALILLIITVPWYMDSKLSGVMLGKLAMMQLFSCLILLAWATKIVFSKETKFVRTPLDVPLLAFCLIMIGSTIFSINPQLSFSGAYYRYEGLITFLNYVFLFYAAVNFITKESLNRIINTIIFAGGLVALYGLLQHWHIDLAGWGNYSADRVFSTFGNPVYLGAYLTTAFPICLAVYLKGEERREGRREKEEGRKKKGVRGKPLKLQLVNYLSGLVTKLSPWWFGVNLALIVAGLVLCRGRGAFLGVMVSLILFVWLSLWKKPAWNRFRVGIALFVILSVGIYFNLGEEASVFKRLSDMFTPTSEVETPASSPRTESLSEPLKKAGGTRIIMWRDCLKIIADYPLLGTGPETFALIYPRYRSLELLRTEGGQFGRPDRVHNDILDLAIASGLLGLSAYLWMLFMFSRVCLQTFFKAHSQAKLLPLGLFCAGAGYFVQNQSCFWILPSTSLFFLSMGLAVVNRPQKAEISLPKPALKVAKMILPLLALMVTLSLAKTTIAYYIADIEFKKGSLLYWGEGKIESVAQFQKALKLNPRERHYYEYLLHAYLDTTVQHPDHAQKAISAGQKVISLYPQESIFRNLLGSAYSVNNQMEQAILQYQQILKIDPLFFDIRSKLANIYAAQKKYDQAILLYQEGLKIEPYSADCLEAIGQIYLLQAKDELAKEVLEKAIKLQPDNFNAHNNLARIYYEKGQIEKVIEHCKEMVRIKPKDLEPRKNLGSLYYKAGRFQEAQQEFIRILQIDPDNSYAKHLLMLIAGKK